jgi:NAD(P)-dependent dehydrogenase (short-subunit alcohol dehydrogenase family)
MGILDGKRILVTGVLTDSSIAFHVARIAQLEGAAVVLTGFGRLSLVERIARRLPKPAPVLELDVTDSGQLESLAERVSAHAGGLDGLVHAIAFAPPGALGGNFLQTPWEDVATAVQVSAYSLKALATAALPLMTSGAEGAAGGSGGSPPRASGAEGATGGSGGSSPRTSRSITAAQADTARSVRRCGARSRAARGFQARSPSSAPCTEGDRPRPPILRKTMGSAELSDHA